MIRVSVTRNLSSRTPKRFMICYSLENNLSAHDERTWMLGCSSFVHVFSGSLSSRRHSRSQKRDCDRREQSIFGGEAVSS